MLPIEDRAVRTAQMDTEGHNIGQAIKTLQEAISGVGPTFDGELEVTFPSGSPVVSVPEGSSRVGIYKCKPTRSAIVSLYNWGPGWVGVVYAAFDSNKIILYTGTATAAYGTVTLTRRDEYMFNGKLNIGDYGQQTEYVEAPENGFNNNGIYVLENVAYNVRGLIVLGAGLGDSINYWGVFNGKVFSGIDQVKTNNIVIKDHLVTGGTKLYSHACKGGSMTLDGGDPVTLGPVDGPTFITGSNSVTSGTTSLFQGNYNPLGFIHGGYLQTPQLSGYIIGATSAGNLLVVEAGNTSSSMYIHNVYISGWTDTVTPL